MPYGLRLAAWDVILTDAELENLFQQVAVMNRARSHCLVLGCIWHDAGRLRKYMMDNGYDDTHLLVIYKPQNNASGMEFINAVETLVVGYKGGIKSCKLTFPDLNPLARHNLLFSHQVGPKLKYTGEDAEVNTTQKNPNVASALGRLMCTPGSWALVIGAGSGSEVLGLARVGVNVVGVERDSKQFRALCARVTAESAFSSRVLKQLTEDEKSLRLLNQVVTKFTKLIPDINSHFMDQDASPADGDSDRLDEADGEELGGSESPTCPACGQAVSVLEAIACVKQGCAVIRMHPACQKTCSMCTRRFCSADCVQAHGCVH